MIKVLDSEDAKKIWDETILSLSNPTYFQSFEYSKAYKEDGDIEFVYTNDTDKKIYGFIKHKNGVLTMPFGPIISSNVSEEDIMKFIVELSNKYNESVVFAVSNDMIDGFNEKYPGLEKTWLFVTPVIDTTLPIETIVKNSTENRRRIIKKGLANISSDRIREGSEYIDDFYDLYLRRMNETNGEVDFTYPQLATYLEDPTTHLVVCLDDKKVIGAHVLFTFGSAMITRYNCFDSDYSKISPAARIEYEMIKKACENPTIETYDMSGLAVGDNVDEKLANINRYKKSYNPTKVLRYQWYKYNE